MNFEDRIKQNIEAHREKMENDIMVDLLELSYETYRLLKLIGETLVLDVESKAREASLDPKWNPQRR